jgi:DNA-binding MarR family transcriptional regulator
MSEGALAQSPKIERRPSAAARAEWRAARLFQRRAQLVLAAERVTFMAWLLLETLRELTEEGLAYVSQRAVAQRAGVAPGMASYWLRMMEEYGLIDRGRDALPTYDLILTSSGETALRRCNERLEAAGLTG